ncbi:MAG TPA: hypothetical protein VJ723_03700 [Candidatus Angelobacter sp.]|nr:hypothetical protein [Candidatus Angelobacter sp.]
MIFGMSLHTYTLVHVVLSLIGIVSGLIVVLGLIAGKRLNGLTALFLLTTIATSATGFGFPVEKLLPSHVIGIFSLVVLAVAVLARCVGHLAGGWRSTYAICAVVALYFNVFVLVVQSFLKVPALHVMAPKGNEPPFLIAQVVVLVIFVVLGIKAVKGFRGA